jgi:N-methylhydantoinase B
VRTADGTLKELPACADIILQPGESIVSYTSGGGGYGPPYERPIEKVKHDVEEGWITTQRAFEVYGVVFTGEGKIDEEATIARRRTLAEMKN